MPQVLGTCIREFESLQPDLKSQNHFIRLFIERLELNARKVRAGWDAIGDELGQTIESFLKQYDSIELAEESK